jgi:nicotinamide phosphoribosyltransferase
MNRSNNPILMTDAYKHSHYLQYPPDTNYVYEYIEARSIKTLSGEDAITKVVCVGQRYLLALLESLRVTSAHVEQAKRIVTAAGEPFNEEGWNTLVERYGGRLLGAVKINTVKEGTIVNPGVPILTVVNTDPDFFWLPGFLETLIQRCIWYPSTVASISNYCYEMIEYYMDLTCDDKSKLPFMLHDFGARGVSSHESAELGGFAHLCVGFMGTDTMEALAFAEEVYDSEMVGFSIPAAEHSTITSWGKDNEVDAYRNMIKQFGGGLFAVVSDSYDIFNACENIWGGVLKDEVLAAPGTLVIRPDSGDPKETVIQCLWILAKKFGYTINTKGFKVLNRVRIIQGDGVNPVSIGEILQEIHDNGFSADNIAFGMGGALLQKLDRDTFSFAMKCSAKTNNIYSDHWDPVFKSPIGQTSKKSKAGIVTTVFSEKGEPVAFRKNNLVERLPVGVAGAMHSLEDAIDQNVESIRARVKMYRDLEASFD